MVYLPYIHKVHFALQNDNSFIGCKNGIKHQLNIQGMMTVVTSVGKVQRVFQLSFLPVWTTELVNKSRNMTQHVVHRHVDFVTVQGTWRFRQTDTEPWTPQLASTHPDQNVHMIIHIQTPLLQCTSLLWCWWLYCKKYAPAVLKISIKHCVEWSTIEASKTVQPHFSNVNNETDGNCMTSPSWLTVWHSG